jgi:hypothetical protein
MANMQAHAAADCEMRTWHTCSPAGQPKNAPAVAAPEPRLMQLCHPSLLCCAPALSQPLMCVLQGAAELLGAHSACSQAAGSAGR